MTTPHADTAQDAAPARTAGSIDTRKAWKTALYAFALSRLLVLVAAALAVATAQQWPTTGATTETQTLRLDERVAAQLQARVLANDGGWYHAIAGDGYEQRPFSADRQANWAFFPLHPWLWRALTATGLGAVPAGLLLANGFFLLALVQAHRWLQAMADGETADRGVLCIALFPTAYFFSLPWTESLFLFVLASGLLEIRRQRWGAAAAFAAAAAGTRAVGVLLAPLLWLAGRADPGLSLRRRTALAAVATTGLLVFMAVLHVRSGNPLAFADIQVAWGRDGGSLFKHFRRWAADPALLATGWNLHVLNNAAVLLGLAGSAWLWWRRERALAAYVFLCVLLPWSTGTTLSMGRYLLGALPLFLALASWLRRPEWLLAWLLASAGGLVWLSAHYALGSAFAGA